MLEVVGNWKGGEGEREFGCNAISQVLFREKEAAAMMTMMRVMIRMMMRKMMRKEMIWKGNDMERE